MNSERKAFIEAFGEMYLDPCDWSEERNCFKESHVHVAWNAWQLSAQRQGYKLVPVDKLIEKWEKEAKYREDIASEDWVSNTINECIDDLKAMIGVVSNDN